MNCYYLYIFTPHLTSIQLSIILETAVTPILQFDLSFAPHFKEAKPIFLFSGTFQGTFGSLRKQSHCCCYSNMAHKQSLQSKLKQCFTKLQYDHPLGKNHLNIPEDKKQTFSTNRPCSACLRHLSKLLVICCNEKVEKSWKEINNILYHLLTIFLIIKAKIGLNLHFLSISCKLSVQNTSYNPRKSSDFG